MKTIYVVVWADYDNWELYGAYSTRELAEQFIARYENDVWGKEHLAIVELVMDRPVERD